MVAGGLGRLWRTPLLAARWGPGVFVGPGLTGQCWSPSAVTQGHCIVRSEVFLTSVTVRCLFCGIVLVALVRRKGMGW